MYARGKDHPLKEACAWLITKIAEGEPVASLRPVIDTEVFQEVLYRYSAINKPTLGVSICRDLRILGIEVLSIGPKEVDLFIDLAEKYGNLKLPMRDIVHLAVMTTNGIDRVITPDKHFDHFPAVKRLDPVDLWEKSGKLG